MSEQELKPCPFCGAEAKLVLTATDWWEVVCTNVEGCGAKLTEWGSRYVIRHWNARPAEVELSKQNDAARATLDRLHDIISRALCEHGNDTALLVELATIIEEATGERD